ncbi:MAG: adenosylcobalamin-dependent ribonucleoside-diphosphate reductase [Methanomassiliicoccales archaeon]|jgi:ribonucleoside-diphosphate reductase alpha chain|nr:adenosylcobalamin-dependent ribonucleoside-diphosphate reductase [Methanomassiliicoccales archaeon]
MNPHEFPELSTNALRVLEKRYLRKDETGKVIETPDEMFRRVAENIASVNRLYHDGRGVEAEAEEFYLMMRKLEFLPNSPALMNAGTEIQQLAACFVIPVEDSIESIYDAIKYAALIHQSGGGTGFSFSKLRPEGDIVKSTGGIASGPVSFMKVFDAATEAIKQGGRRRGASMGVLRVDHPDIKKFIRAKEDLHSLSNFNISVSVTNEFMRKVELGQDFDLINPRNGKVMGTLNASELFNEICYYAWKTGDPGLIFYDTINEANPTPGLGPIEATNPCGEVPLLPFEACNLGSINLSRLVREKRGDREFDWERLEELVDAGIRFLDNVIDASRYPLPQVTEIARGNRKIGLGVMGFADALLKLGIPYGSDESMRFAEKVISFIRKKGEETTRRIGEERGSFPNIDKSIYRHPRRNATILSIAPTGTISIIADCSSGIEPLYAIYYVRHVLEGEHLREIHPEFVKIAKERGFYSAELINSLSTTTSIQHLDSIPEDVRKLFLTSHDVPPEQQVRLQSVFQKYVDNAVSKTINMRSTCTVRDVSEIFKLAFALKCKGITVYREGSKPGQVFTTAKGGITCPDCGGVLRVEEGTFVCSVCGLSNL